jgi:hypothetical protein
LFTPELQFLQHCIIDSLLQSYQIKRAEAAATAIARMALILVITMNMQDNTALSKAAPVAIPATPAPVVACSSDDGIIIEF